MFAPSPQTFCTLTIQVLKVPVHREIRQLSVSPSGEYIAILTSHNVYVAILPDSSLLDLSEKTPLKLKTFQVGPTAHVVERSPVMSALWHPLAVNGSCLVTVTEDAVARLWELNRDNRWSFDNPAFALDLRKLANGPSPNGDYLPTKYGTSIGFSPDQFDMEVASACFGGTGANDEDGWAPTTLWVAMKNGDIYALCPFLPSQWSLAKSQISSLVNGVETSKELTAGEDLTKKDKNAIEQQLDWTDEILAQQESQEADAMDGEGFIYTRPSKSGAIPALQGPFHLEPDSDLVFDITDIFAIASSFEPVQDEDALGNEEQHNDESAPETVICLATSDGKIHTCLNTQSVRGVWISKTSEALGEVSIFNDEQLPELLLVESIKMQESEQQLAWPVFSPCLDSRFGVFVTGATGISFLRPLSSLARLSEEFNSSLDQSSEYRVKILAENSEVDLQRLIRFEVRHQAPTYPIAACVHIRDSDMGDFVLASANGQPLAATLDFSDLDLLFEGEEYSYGSDDEFNALFPEDTREVYQPPPALWAETTLLAFADEQRSGTVRQIIEKELRLAPATVNLMMEAHRLLGYESAQVQDSVSSLFQRCQRMHDELKAHLQRLGEISSKIDSVLDDNAEAMEEHDGDEDVTKSIPQRFRDVQTRHEILQKRYTKLKDKVAQLDRRPLSAKERPWIQEIDSLQRLVIADEAAENGDTHLRDRLAAMNNIKEDLIARSGNLQQSDDANEAESSLRRTKMGMTRVMTMLERETALVDATTEKLAELKPLA